MSKTMKLALAAAVPALLLAGCTDFLKGPGLSQNPNKPVSATADQLWTDVEVAVMAQYENYPLMLFMVWSQNIAGVNRQWQTYATYSSGIDENAASGAWDQTYGPGGLRDIKTIEDSTTAKGAIKWRGMAEVLEALYMGTAADIWGSVPYSTAITTAQPTFDTQAQVYTEVQATLNKAIADLASTDGITPSAEFFYNSKASSWIALAHTLKARFFMHNAETSAGVYSTAILDSVFKYSSIGITSTGTEMLPVHNGSPGAQNLFFSFQVSRAGDVDPAATHINLTKAAGLSSLLKNWYTPNQYGNYYGAMAATPNDPVAGLPSDSIAAFEVANDPAAAWPFVGYAENQMLLAEAQCRGATGQSCAAGFATLNAYRVGQGYSALPDPVSDNVRISWILREKFVHAFFNMETWNDYLRTCYPNIPQPFGVDPAAAYVPARLPVGYTEQVTNPNMPSQPQGNPPNANVHKHLTALDGSSCIGQANQP